jgi:transcriptional regulator with XRE-family HTH domain
MVISAAQIRAARGLLGWTQAKLAAESGLSEISIQNIEKGATDPRASTLTAIERAFERAGVEFTNGARPGVRLQERCPTCFGTGDYSTMREPKRGAKILYQPCPDCSGTGRKTPQSIPIDKLNASSDD